LGRVVKCCVQDLHLIHVYWRWTGIYLRSHFVRSHFTLCIRDGQDEVAPQRDVCLSLMDKMKWLLREICLSISDGQDEMAPQRHICPSLMDKVKWHLRDISVQRWTR